MTGPAEILLVDDDDLIQLMVEDLVTGLGHRFTAAETGAAARRALEDRHFDLVILDRRLPDTDGLVLAQAIRAGAGAPFIVLSSLGTADDQVLGLGLGALDYICKPVEPAVLRARIERHMRHHRPAPAEEAVLRLGTALELDQPTRRLAVAGRTEVLSPAETRLLACLIRSAGQPLDRRHISAAVCGREWVYGDRTIDVLISRLRRRLRGGAVEIATVHGVGYILSVGTAGH